MINRHKLFIFLLFVIVTIFSCVDEIDVINTNNNNPSNPPLTTNSPLYIYPFGDEVSNSIVEITIQTDGTIDLNSLEAEIPHLKYNKSLLFMFTQDDCRQDAFSCTWAAINGKPLTNQYFYDIRHLLANDLPPDIYYLGKTLGTNDGLENEVRFHFTTTVYPQKNLKEGYASMYDAPSTVNPGFNVNYYRFFMKSFLIWDNVKEMLNYGNSIAFHDVALDTTNNNVNNQDSILLHFAICQDSIKKNLNQRGCKVLAEPNGNINYYYAALNYNLIKIITGQGNAPYILYPFNVNYDLEKEFINREFAPLSYFQSKISEEMQKPKEQRKAVRVGIHGAGEDWVEFLLWINDNYGKDGDNSVWVPSLEEYYEYNYYRIHSNITKTIIDNNTVKFTITLPSQQYFYYPSITLNLKGITNSKIQNLTTNDVVKGLNYGDYSEGVMINIDCRKYLLEHATHYVEQYERNKTKSNKDDALYFTNMLKNSNQKTDLLNRINR